MKEMFEKAILMGIGMASMTAEKIQDFAKNFAEEAKMSEEEGRKFVDDLLNKSKEAQKNIDNMVNEKIKEKLKKLDVATVQDVQKINERLDKIEDLLKK